MAGVLSSCETETGVVNFNSETFCESSLIRYRQIEIGVPSLRFIAFPCELDLCAVLAWYFEQRMLSAQIFVLLDYFTDKN